MKIRMGFVSNSSSTSFCVLGLLQSELKKYLPEMEETEDFDINNYIEDKVNDDNTLAYQCGIEEFYDDYVIGYSVGNLDKDKTINQLRQELKEKLDEMFDVYIDIGDIGWCVDGGHD